MKLEPTGERMIVEHYRSSPEDYVIYLFHLATYQFAEQYTSGLRVLDYGCGSGYGSSMIAKSAAHVTAVDVAKDAISHARKEFGGPNIDFLSIDPEQPLPFADASFDTVLSFQVFEHVANTDRYLSEIRRVLLPDGKLILVTPDRATRLLPFQKPWNRWHLKEYDNNSLRKLVTAYFPDTDIFHMSGRRDVIDIEIRRCARLKWMTLPFTLPFFTDRVRVGLLNRLHALRARPSAETAPQLSFDYDESVIRIERDAEPSVNLIAVASK